jgi:hypothetical protein
MNRSALLCALLALAATAPALAKDGGAAPPAGQPPAAGPTKDAEAVQFLKELQPQIGKQADSDAKSSIKKLVDYWKDKDVSEATKKPIPELLHKYAKDAKLSVPLDAIDALGETGQAGASALLDLLERTLKEKEPNADTYSHSLASLKKIADPRPATVKQLVDLLKFKVDAVIAKAADAISGYKDAPGKVRKELFEELVKQSEGVFNGSKDAKKSDLVRRWQVIGASVVNALNALSGQKFSDPAAARQWFNDHKTDKIWS